MIHPDDAPTSEELRAQIIADAAAGIKRFSDGSHTVEMDDLTERLAVADSLELQEEAANFTLDSWFFGATRILRSPGAWQ